MHDHLKPNYLEQLGSVEDLAGLLNCGGEPNSPAAIAAASSNVLRHMRARLDMEVAFVAEFEKTMRHFRYVDHDPQFRPVCPGDRMPLSSGYCKKVVDGLIPEMAGDTDEVAVLQGIPETRQVPVRSYITVPLTLARAELYGTLCCFSRKPHPSMGGQDHRWVRDFAGLIGMWIAAGRRLADPFGWASLPAFAGREQAALGGAAGSRLAPGTEVQRRGSFARAARG